MVRDYERLLQQAIPVVNDMDISIEKLEDTRVVLKAPLKKNINYEGSAFGGSLNTVATLSGYLLTRYLLEVGKISFSSLVIQACQIQYLAPVREDFFSRAEVTRIQIEKFLNTFQRKGAARLQVKAEIFCGPSEKALVLFSGQFVAMK